MRRPKFNATFAGTSKNYTVPLTARVPPTFKRQVGDEAVARGTSLCDYAATILMSNYEKGSQDKAQLELALAEKQMLQKKVETLEAQWSQYSEADLNAIGQLANNRDLLKKLAKAATPITKAQLKALGFDFSVIMRVAQLESKQYYVLFDMCYTLDGDSVIIKLYSI